MNRLILAAVLTGAAALSACNDPEPQTEETAEAPMVEPVAPPAAESAVPATTEAPAAPATDSTALPPEKRSSEESVRPESETLFY